MTDTAHPTQLYDQTLRQLELGRTGSAIQSLAGIFDGVLASDGDVAVWRENLLTHPLFEVLSALEAAGDPVIAELGTNQAATSRETLAARAHASGATDQIFAVSSPDLLETGGLADELAALREQLLPSGRIFISSFVPNHLGLGWRRIFGGGQTHCHDEQSLKTAAAAAGLSIQHFRDASDCLVWAVLTHRQSN